MKIDCDKNNNKENQKIKANIIRREILKKTVISNKYNNITKKEKQRKV